MRARDRFARAGFPCRAVALRRLVFARLSFRLKQMSIKHLMNESRLAGARDAGDTIENAERDFDIDILEIVLARAGDSDRGRRFAARLGDRDRFTTTEIIARQ